MFQVPLRRHPRPGPGSNALSTLLPAAQAKPGCMRPALGANQSLKSYRVAREGPARPLSSRSPWPANVMLTRTAWNGVVPSEARVSTCTPAGKSPCPRNGAAGVNPAARAKGAETFDPLDQFEKGALPCPPQRNNAPTKKTRNTPPLRAPPLRGIASAFTIQHPPNPDRQGGGCAAKTQPRIPTTPHRRPANYPYRSLIQKPVGCILVFETRKKGRSKTGHKEPSTPHPGPRDTKHHAFSERADQPATLS